MSVLPSLWFALRLLTVVLTCAAVGAVAHERGLASALTILFLFVPVGWIGVIAAWSILADLSTDLSVSAASAAPIGSHLRPDVVRCIQRDVAERQAIQATERRILQQRDRDLEVTHEKNRHYASLGRPVAHFAPAPRLLAALAAEVRGPDENAILRGEAVAALPLLAANGEGEIAGLGFEIRVAHHRDESRRAR